MTDLIETLKERGFVDAITSDELQSALKKPCSLYVGFDPTADSLHLGNLMGIIALRWFQKFGHTPFVILGGGTGRIGDPSGKSVERPLLSPDVIETNIRRIRKHFEQILDFSVSNAPVILNNDEWLSKFGMIEFLRDVGKNFRLGTMLAKESVKARLQSEEGISFTEFTYQMLQAYDFFHLSELHNVSLQMGGSDQWGNITAGIELIRRLSGKPAYGLTFPLLTRSDGKKFGKSEEGSIWLAADRCSPYHFYQYLFRMADSDIPKMLKLLTFLDIREIQEIEKSMHSSSYVPNSAQKRLAEEVTRIVHGEEGLNVALRVTEGAAPGSQAVLDVASIEMIAADMPHAELPFDQVLGLRFVDVAAASGLTSSKGEAMRLIQGGGAYLNNEKIEDSAFKIEEKNLIGRKYLLLGSGKKKKILVIVS